MGEDVDEALVYADASGEGQDEGLNWVEVMGQGRGEDLDCVEILRKCQRAKYFNYRVIAENCH